MSNHLTSHQERVYLFIKDYITRYKYSPYIREIQASCSIRSHKNVIDRLNALERKGYIRRKISQHRSIRLINKKDRSKKKETEYNNIRKEWENMNGHLTMTSKEVK